MAAAEGTEPKGRPAGRPTAGAAAPADGSAADRAIVGLDSALRLGAGRVRLWAIGLFAMGVVPIIGAPFNHWHDWGALWAAGATAGGPDLVDAGLHVAWQERARGFGGVLRLSAGRGVAVLAVRPASR